jgi:hypothetical protein
LHWQLTSNTYWRREDEDIIVVHGRTILRLNAASARLFEMLLRGEQISVSDKADSAALIQLLVAEAVLKCTSGPSDYTQSRLGHFPTTAV